MLLSSWRPVVRDNLNNRSFHMLRHVRPAAQDRFDFFIPFFSWTLLCHGSQILALTILAVNGAAAPSRVGGPSPGGTPRPNARSLRSIFHNQPERYNGWLCQLIISQTIRFASASTLPYLRRFNGRRQSHTHLTTFLCDCFQWTTDYLCNFSVRYSSKARPNYQWPSISGKGVM